MCIDVCEQMSRDYVMQPLQWISLFKIEHKNVNQAQPHGDTAIMHIICESVILNRQNPQSPHSQKAPIFRTRCHSVAAHCPPGVRTKPYWQCASCQLVSAPPAYSLLYICLSHPSSHNGLIESHRNDVVIVDVASHPSAAVLRVL